MRRRDFLKSIAFAATAPAFANSAFAIPAPPPGAMALRATRRVLDVDGKAASVFGLTRPDGGHGVTLDPGQRFSVRLVNDLGEPTIIHWHGQTPPWFFDGVADAPLPLMRAGEVRDYDFAPVAGTHFMHAHTMQEQTLLAAPLIVRTPQDLRRDVQDVTMFLHDFSWKSPQELLAGLVDGAGHDMGAMKHDMGAMKHDMGAMKHDASSADPHAGHAKTGHAKTGHAKTGPANSGHAKSGEGVTGGAMAAMDLNDIEYDAYLANDRTLGDPDVVRVDKGGRVRLRVVNAAASTAFLIDTGALEGRLVAVDGREVDPVSARGAGVTMGQRLDIVLSIPKQGGAFPIFARREGAHERAAIVLTTVGARLRRLERRSATPAAPLNLDLEARLRAAAPLPARPVEKRFSVALTGEMSPYSWAMRSEAPLRVRQGERVEIEMINRSMMSHPMHLHGHAFQVVAINGRPLAGALRDTVLVPPGSRVTVAFDADNPGRWAFHCHHLYHMFAGMMGEVVYEGVG